VLIGAYGQFWERNQVDWGTYKWRLLGRQGVNTGTLKIADFRSARGVYVLYNELGVYYVGLASEKQGLGGRLKDHLVDKHGSRWTRFSWFSFDSPGVAVPPDGVRQIKQHNSVKADTPVMIRDLEALLQIAMQPFANRSETKFAKGSKWIQVATTIPEVRTFDHLKKRLKL
jgi:hypothetical protein